MALDFDKLSPQELLAAESAVLTMRSLMDGLGTKEAEKWVHARVIELIDKGGPGFIKHLNDMGAPDTSSATAEVWTKLLH